MKTCHPGQCSLLLYNTYISFDTHAHYLTPFSVDSGHVIYFRTWCLGYLSTGVSDSPPAVDYSRLRIESLFFTCMHGHQVRFHHFPRVPKSCCFRSPPIQVVRLPTTSSAVSLQAGCVGSPNSSLKFDLGPPSPHLVLRLNSYQLRIYTIIYLSHTRQTPRPPVNVNIGKSGPASDHPFPR